MSARKSPTPVNGTQVSSPIVENPKSPNNGNCDPRFIQSNIIINKQISKLKRFLSTLLSFGSDIDSNTGEIVRNLVFALLCNKISIEQFQTKLQQATHFPLKAFVTPFLKATLPMLQQEILLCSQLVHQTPENFLLHNREYLIHMDGNKNESPMDNAKHFCLDFSFKDSKDIDQSKSPEIVNDSLKDLSSKKSINNKNPLKRSISMKAEHEQVDFKNKEFLFSPNIPTTISSWKPSLIQVSNVCDRIDKMDCLAPSFNAISSSAISWPSSLLSSPTIDSGTSAKHRAFTDKLHHHWDQLLAHISNFQAPVPTRPGPFQFTTTDYEIISGFDDVIKYQEEHHKGIIQQLKIIQENIRRQKEDNKFSELLHGNSNASLDVSNIRRRAAKYYDDAVQEVQKVAQVELKRTIKSLQEQTIELLEQEKTRFQYVIEDVRRQCKEEYARVSSMQDEGIENCQNCGRKASEACSGCQMARYCGRFCQQKDWSRHKNECGQPLASANKMSKFDNFDVISSSSKSPTQHDPENLSLKRNQRSSPDLTHCSKPSSSPTSSVMPITCHNHKTIEDQTCSDDTVLIDI